MTFPIAITINNEATYAKKTRLGYRAQVVEKTPWFDSNRGGEIVGSSDANLPKVGVFRSQFLDAFSLSFPRYSDQVKSLFLRLLNSSLTIRLKSRILPLMKRPKRVGDSGKHGMGADPDTLGVSHGLTARFFVPILGVKEILRKSFQRSFGEEFKISDIVISDGAVSFTMKEK